MVIIYTMVLIVIVLTIDICHQNRIFDKTVPRIFSLLSGVSFTVDRREFATWVKIQCEPEIWNLIKKVGFRYFQIRLEKDPIETIYLPIVLSSVEKAGNLLKKFPKDVSNIPAHLLIDGKFLAVVIFQNDIDWKKVATFDILCDGEKLATIKVKGNEVLFH